MIEFTRSEVSTYYALRVPALRETSANQWRGPCPVHNGKDHNFAVNAETGEAICFSQCGRGWDIIKLEMELIGVDFKTAKAEVFRLVGRIEPEYRHNGTPTNGASAGNAAAKSTDPRPWREIECYRYTDAEGRLLYEVVRRERGEGAEREKTFLIRRPDGRGGWLWNLDGVERVPYRLPQVLKSETVYLPEGEKDVHTLEGWGLAASCNPGGAGQSHLYEKWVAHFRGKHVVVLPDNDAPGRKHAAAVAVALLSVAASVRIVELPDLPDKGDVTDWQDAGGTLDGLQELTVATAPLNAEALFELCTQWGLADGASQHEAAPGAAAHDWPKPEPIQSELPPVDAFSEELLPDCLRPLVRDVAERMQVPMDYPAVVMVLCLAGAVNRRATIQPKERDAGWIVVPNLWGGIIAPPGYLKSPVIQATTRPLNRIQTDWRQTHEEDLKKHALAKEEYELRRAGWREEYKKHSKNGTTAPDRPDNEPEAPKLRRLVVNDATFEALHQTMSDNPAGILVIRDELTGWWSQLDRSGREGERAFCLQAWNGDTGHTIDRIGRGTIHVEACCMSMLGGIQPGRLRSYLVDALEDGPSNDGLIQRFQLLVWPETSPDWSYVDRPADVAAEQIVERVFHALVELDPENPLHFCFAPDAQELFVGWLTDLEEKIRGEELHPALISHLSKYRSLMPSLALLFELAERAGSEGFEGSSLPDSQNFVSLEHAQQAAAFCEYLESHARRVYSCIVTPQLRAARELAEKIKDRKVGADGFFSCRDVYLKGWSGLDSPEAVKQAAEILRDAGWLRELPGDSGRGGGRPSNRYEVNPRVWE